MKRRYAPFRCGEEMRSYDSVSAVRPWVRSPLLAFLYFYDHNRLHAAYGIKILEAVHSRRLAWWRNAHADAVFAFTRYQAVCCKA